MAIKNRRTAKVYEERGEYALKTSLDYDGDVGYDLGAAEDTVILADDQWHQIRTGVHVSPPPGFWFELCSRSSTTVRRGLIVARGIIDAGYRGPLVIFAKTDRGRAVHVAKGERIAQLIAHPVIHMDWERVTEIDDLGKSERGTNGFGSTGS